MDRPSGVITSFITLTLLQERFKQLQRAKEIREERELLRLLPESTRASTTMPSYEPSGLLFHSELIPAPRQPLLPIQSSPHLQTNLQLKENDIRIIETPILANEWSKDAVMHGRNFLEDDCSDVDTSLHL